MLHKMEQSGLMRETDKVLRRRTQKNHKNIVSTHLTRVLTSGITKSERRGQRDLLTEFESNRGIAEQFNASGWSRATHIF